MKVSIFIKRNPSQLELKEYQRFSDKNWGKHYESEEEVKENFFDIPKFVVLAYTKNRLVGLLNIFIKKAIIENLSFSVGGIGGVVTDKEFRHKGIATIILKKTMQVLKLNNIDVAMLCTDIPKLGHLYNKLDFVPLGKPYYFFSKNGDERAENSGMIAPVKSLKIFRKIMLTKGKISVGQSNF